MTALHWLILLLAAACFAAGRLEGREESRLQHQHRRAEHLRANRDRSTE